MSFSLEIRRLVCVFLRSRWRWSTFGSSFQLTSSGENSEWQVQDVRKQRWQNAWQPKFGIKEPEESFNLSTRHGCWDETTPDGSTRISGACLAVVVHFILTNPHRQQPKTIPGSFYVGGIQRKKGFIFLLSKIPLSRVMFLSWEAPGMSDVWQTRASFLQERNCHPNLSCSRMDIECI